MIRATTEADHEELILLAAASGLFAPHQKQLPAEMLRAPAESDIWLTLDLAGRPEGVAYLTPEKMTFGTWNLYWIAVHPRCQRRGSETSATTESTR